MVCGIPPSVACNSMSYKLKGTRKARRILSAKFIGFRSCTPSAEILASASSTASPGALVMFA
eukprot:4639708-Prorocentrum_lima.AAC.1